MIEILIVIVCLIFNALLSGAEMAFVTAAKSRLRELARAGNRAAQNTLKLRENPERTLSVIQVGITLVGAIAAAVGGAGAEESISPILMKKFQFSEHSAEFLSILIVVIPLTYLSVVLGELVPKTIALKDPVGISLKSAYWLALIDKIISPVVSLLEWSTRKILRIFFRKSKAAQPPSTQTDTVELDRLSQQTKQYVLNLVGIEERRIKDIYLPWNQVTSVESTQSMIEVESVIVSSGHTRIPVLKNNIVVGVINSKEFLALKALDQSDWNSIARKVVEVQEGETLLRALRLMQESRSHLSLVYSANRILLGIVTMEDIFEEVIGDIFDEDDDSALKRVLSSRASVRRISPNLE